MRSVALVLLSLLGLALLPGAAAAQAPPDAGARLEPALKKLVRMRGGPPGAFAVVQRGADVQVQTAGVADVRTRARWRASDHMRLASFSKAFSGATSLALVSQGLLRLDESITVKRPDLPAAWSGVTLRQALNHTSGLPNYTEAEALQSRLQKTPRTPLPPRALIDFVAGEPLRFAPGTRYRYSNTDNIVVGLLVEAASGQSYDAALQSLVFGPLGLTQTSLPAGFRIPAPYVHGYDVQPPQRPQDISTVISQSLLWAAGGMISTPAEVNAFIRGYAGGPRLFGEVVRAEQLDFIRGGSSEPPGPGANSAGLAVFRYETRCGTVFGHTGNFPGYTQFAATSPDGTRSVVVSASEQLSPDIEGKTRVFAALRRVDELAVCAALAG